MLFEHLKLVELTVVEHHQLVTYFEYLPVAFLVVVMQLYLKLVLLLIVVAVVVERLAMQFGIQLLELVQLNLVLLFQLQRVVLLLYLHQKHLLEQLVLEFLEKRHGASENRPLHLVPNQGIWKSGVDQPAPARMANCPPT